MYADEGLIGEYKADGPAIRTYGYVGGEPLFLKKDGQYYWYRNDRLGTPQTLETGSGENVGKVVWAGEYDSFGNFQVTVGEVENNLRLPGQYFDEETGLYYNLNRYYDPKTGRYLQTDPAGDGLNPYAYVGGNPVNAIDPNGLCAFRMVGGIADIGVGLLLTAKTGGIGLVVAWGLIINGADNLVAGAYSMIAGEEIPSLIQSGFRRAIPNRTAADLAYMGFEISLNVAGLAVERAAQRAAAQVAGSGISETGYATRFRGFKKIALRSQKLNADEFGKWQPGWSKIRINFQKIKKLRFFKRARLEITAYHEAFHQGAYFKVSRHVSRWLGVRDVYESSIVWRLGEELSAEIYGVSRMVLRRGFGIK